MRLPDRSALRFAIVLAAGGVTLSDAWASPSAPATISAPVPAPEETGDAIPDMATRRAVIDATYAYFAAKDGGHYTAAYARFADSVHGYLSPDLYRSQSTDFAAAAGRGGERRLVRISWYRDPPDAPAPGLYAAADFVSRFPNLRLHCGYLMWHQEADGGLRIVREEQSFLDEATARQMTPERLRPLPRQFGCVGATGTLE